MLGYTLTKVISEGVVSYGTGYIISKAIKHVTPHNMNKATKVCVGAASFVIANLAGNKLVDYMDEQYTKLEESVKEIIAEKASEKEEKKEKTL